MTHLRRKLEGSGRRVFRTEAGVGYGLECPDEGPR
jgi:DNA-binding response OmpR family regulator